MSAGAPPPSSPDPPPSIVVAPSDPVAMPPPAPAPPVAEDDEEMPAPPVAAEEDEERPWPPMRMKLFPYAVYCVLGGMGRTGDQLGVAWVVILYANIIASLLSFYTGGGQARFWTLVSRVTQFLGHAFTVFIIYMFIRYYMRVDGEYHMVIDLPPRLRQQLAPAAAAEEQLPPPPPQMDMC